MLGGFVKELINGPEMESPLLVRCSISNEILGGFIKQKGKFAETEAFLFNPGDSFQIKIT